MRRDPDLDPRAPLVAMPYPEGGDYNPPLPPIQIPPEMLPPASAELPDSGAPFDR